MNNIKILYIYPFESYGTPFLLNSFIRISNFLNSKEKELNGLVDEKYLDLRYENLPEFIPKNLQIYRNKLRKLLKENYKKFKFNLVAISCYGGYSYINTIETANLIKKFINPKCIIVVGGPHATINPEDFQPASFPNFISEEYPQNTSPFDYLIKDEGELPFFKLVKDLLNNKINRRNSLSKNCIILEPELVSNLDDIPIIDLSLYEKYKNIIKKNNRIFLEFTRGCIFRCNFCPNSESFLDGYKTLRVKPVKKCIEELNVIKNTKWLSVKQVEISDMIFLPKKSLREQFFKELERIYQEEGGLPFQLRIETRVDTCNIEDLEIYKKFNIFLRIGLESCSKTLLYRMGKICGKNEEQIKRGINRYLMKFEEIIREANKLDLPISYYILMGLPGEDRSTIQENWDFFFQKRGDGKSLAEKYKINIRFNKYLAFSGSEVYSQAQNKYGAKIYYKNWWKIFNEKQPYYSMIVDPSKDFNFMDSLTLNFKFIKEIIKVQNALRNPFYSVFRLLSLKKQNFVNFNLYKKLMLRNTNN